MMTSTLSQTAVNGATIDSAATNSAATNSAAINSEFKAIAAANVPVKTAGFDPAIHKFPTFWSNAATRIGLELKMFARDRDHLFWVLAFPMLLLLLFSLIFGNYGTIYHPENPALYTNMGRIMVPGQLAFAVMMASFTTLAGGIALEREKGNLKRLRNSPMPAAAYFVGKIVMSLIVVFVQATLMITVGVLFLGAALPATLAQWGLLIGFLLLGAAAGGAAGIAFSSIPRTAKAANNIASGVPTILAFISGVFIVGSGFPEWLIRIGQIFPMYWIAAGLRSAFMPHEMLRFFSPLDEPSNLWIGVAVLVAWLVVSLLVALKTFRWQQSRDEKIRRVRSSDSATTTIGAASVGEAAKPATQHHSVTAGSAAPAEGRVKTAGFNPAIHKFPSFAANVATRISMELKMFFRDRQHMFWVIAFPMLLLVLFSIIFGTGEQIFHPANPYLYTNMGRILVPGQLAYAVMMASFATLASSIATEREKGNLKRLRNSPMPPAAYFVGKIVMSLLVVTLQAVLMIAVGVLFMNVALPTTLAQWGLLVGFLLLGAAAGATAGIAFSSIPKTAKAAANISSNLPTLLAFISGIFIVSTAFPQWLIRIGQVFPMYWIAAGLRSAFMPHDMLQFFSPTGTSPNLWLGAGVLAVWLIVGLVVSIKTFRWQQKRGQ